VSGKAGTEQLERVVEKPAEASAASSPRPRLGCHVECADAAVASSSHASSFRAAPARGGHFQRERRAPTIALLQQPPT
jgi:hypothetical protein